MDLKGINFKINTPSAGVGLLMLVLTQLPLALNESLKLVCIATTWADYAVFWSWDEIPLDARVRYCEGGSLSLRSLKETVSKN